LSLQPCTVAPVPELTAQVAHAAFPKGTPYPRLCDELGTISRDDDFVYLNPRRGQPAFSPSRLALVTILQFREGLSGRQAADAVRARIDWKYLLGPELTDPVFNFSVPSEFRSRLLAGQAGERLLERLLARCHRRVAGRVPVPVPPTLQGAVADRASGLPDVEPGEGRHVGGIDGLGRRRIPP
jgi:transposase